MRTPNCQCVICGKPLYRRPFELKKVRYVACIKHRAEAQRATELTKAQQTALSLGRTKGTNHLEGIPKSKESNVKRSKSIKKFLKEHPIELLERSKKIRGENHYKWNGGSSRLNTSIRSMNENRKWMDAVKKRDERCVVCGRSDNLESHHVTSLADLIEKYGIKNREQARECAELWDLSNGMTLCMEHHYQIHGRNYENQRRNIQEVAA